MIWIILILSLPYLFIILGINKALRKVKQFKPETISSVFISVVVACRNEEENLADLLNDLCSQDYDPDLFETIIVDDNSTDSTFKLASSYNKIKNYKVIKNPSRGKKYAINAGVNEASGKLIITTDADCRSGKQWISTIASYFSAKEPDMIIAPVQLETSMGFSGRFRELEFLSLQGITAGTVMGGYPVMCNGANLAFKREVFINHAENLHNDIQSGDDIFFLHSLKKAPEAKIAYISSPEVIVTTRQTDSFSSYIKQRARWISKAKTYNDRFTIILSLITFTAILLNIFLLAAGIIDPGFFKVFLVAIILKSIPDFLILYETIRIFNKRHMLRWFIPSQLVYPFYVLIVVCVSVFAKTKWK